MNGIKDICTRLGTWHLEHVLCMAAYAAGQSTVSVCFLCKPLSFVVKLKLS